jgi:integrase
MASLIREPGKSKNSYRLVFSDSNRQRRSIRFRAPKAHAEAIKTNVEHIIEAKKHNVPVDPATQSWLNRLNDEMSAKLAAVGLIESRTATQLLCFVEGYIASRGELNRNTLNNWKQTQNALVGFWGLTKDIRSINEGNCDAFRMHLVSSGRAQATIAKIIKQSRQLFKAAKRLQLIDNNPFADIKAGTQRNAARQFFVKREIIDQLIKTAPSMDWVLILALSRYGGLRCPSEVLSLRWCDIDFEAGKIAVQSPKGKCHGKGVRMMPIFPELLEPLTKARELAAADAIYVVSHYRDASKTNLRTQLIRMLKKAGITQWPRLFHNLRASRETELVRKFDIKTVTTWLGNSPVVALEHYLQTTPEHFERALTEDTRL